GLASVFDASAEHSHHKALLYAAERDAKAAGRGMWADYDAEAEARTAAEKAKEEQARAAGDRQLEPRIEFLDVAVSELASTTSLFVQIAKKSKIDELESMMTGLAIDHPAGGAGFAPKAGQLVCACYTVGDEWHRARIVKVLPAGRFEVSYIDFGNAETLDADRIRPLPAKFAAAEPYAIPAQLAFLRLPSGEFAADYVPEAYATLRQLLEGRQLVANVEARPPNAPLQLTFYDPKLGRPVLEQSVNGEIAAAGFALADRRALASRHNTAAAAKLEEIVAEARTARRGMWEYGDLTADE
ncbi:hypothetical protein IWQ57_003882, partial [Coemansia nantahalensis]